MEIPEAFSLEELLPGLDATSFLDELFLIHLIPVLNVQNEFG